MAPSSQHPARAKATARHGDPVVPEPAQHPGSEAEDIPPPPENEFPLALRRLHSRLNNELELHKLHVKHYHMSPAQFRRRTSELHLPQEIHDKYQMVVRKCAVCAQGAPKPHRSHVSGLRANNFGDLVFVDHLQVPQGEALHFVLVVLDGATNLLWSAPQKTKGTEETMDILREWMDNFQCVPKCMVADMAFATKDLDRFYRHWGIHLVTLGPRTPWPNRAESAVRLFKRMFNLLVTANSTRPYQLRPCGSFAAWFVGPETPRSR